MFTYCSKNSPGHTGCRSVVRSHVSCSCSEQKHISPCWPILLLCSFTSTHRADLYNNLMNLQCVAFFISFLDKRGIASSATMTLKGPSCCVIICEEGLHSYLQPACLCVCVCLVISLALCLDTTDKKHNHKQQGHYF